MPENSQLKQHAQLFDLLRQQELDIKGHRGKLERAGKSISHADAMLIQSQAEASFRAQRVPQSEKNGR